MKEFLQGISVARPGVKLLALLSVISILSVVSAASERPLFRLSRANKLSSTTPQPSFNQTSTPQTLTSTLSTQQANQKRLSDTPTESTSTSNDAPAAATRNARQVGDFARCAYGILVTNTCDLESMHVVIKTSRPFFGVIHTKNERRKAVCSIEGDGSSEYELDISHVLTSSDPRYCGVVRAPRNSPQDKDILNTVLAIRWSKSIELSDDLYVMLNCTNRCRRADCSSERKSEPIRRRPDDREVEDDAPNNSTNTALKDECDIYRFPWAVALMWCMAVMILALLIFNCLVCSNFHCRWVKKEIEDREESIFEETDYGETSCDDDLDNKNNKNNKNKRNKHNNLSTTNPKLTTGAKSPPAKQISYNNKEVYKTSSYAPYSHKDTRVKHNQR